MLLQDYHWGINKMVILKRVACQDTAGLRNERHLQQCYANRYTSESHDPRASACYHMKHWREGG
jgi:hypothetical protein